MEKDFLKLQATAKRNMRILFIGGIAVTVFLGVRSYKQTILKEYHLPRREFTEGPYEQEIIADLGETKIPVKVLVEERLLSAEEAERAFSKAEEALPNLLKGQNEELFCVTSDLNFLDEIPGTGIEVEWTEKQLDYFYSDGKIRENLQIREPVELKLSAVLICQDYTKEYHTIIRIFPKERSIEQTLKKMIEQKSEDSKDQEMLILPKEFEGQKIEWKKPLDFTFLYFFLLISVTVMALKFAEKRDRKEERRRCLEELESDYAQIVSKFSMLLSAGLSIRNAWERIVLMQKRKGNLDKLVYQEMNWGAVQMQKGISELEVYEKFGIRVNEMHYKKLMSLFVSDKRRGSVPILEAMNQEMILAWEEQRRKIRQQGEKIGTKLLIPMMGMLGVVFIMVLVPAFLSFQL